MNIYVEEERKGKEVIYLAGEMDKRAMRGQENIAEWRQKVINSVKNAFDANTQYIKHEGGLVKDLDKWGEENENGILFLCPEGAGCDHTGLDPSETVVMDMDCVQQSTLIYSNLNRSELYGTVVEIMTAIGMWRNQIIKVNPELSILSTEHNISIDVDKLGTNHGCSCCWHKHRNCYWFLLTYVEDYNCDSTSPAFARDTKAITYESEDTNIELFNYLIRKGFKYNQQYLDELESFQKDIESELIDENSDYKKSVVIQKFSRNIKMINELKSKHGKCQICGYTFLKKNGQPYNETHHIVPLSEKGKDAEINTLVVCANCHRKLHYANTDISNILNGIVVINNEKYTIKE